MFNLYISYTTKLKQCQKTKLSVRQKSNIRFFIYYLVNGTLDFDLLNNQLGIDYYEYLKTHPELFYKACCAFIDLECSHSPNWPDISRLGALVAHWIEPDRFNKADEVKEEEYSFKANLRGLKEAFLEFSNRFSIGQASNPFMDGVSYSDFINDGATNVETCFVIWAKVIEFKDGAVNNQEYAIGRVKEYLKMYYGNGYQAQLEDWEWELHFFEA